MITTRRVPVAEQELLTNTRHTNSSLILHVKKGGRLPQSLVFVYLERNAACMYNTYCCRSK